MASFGQLIENDTPAVLFFTTFWMNNNAESDRLTFFMRDLATIYQDKLRVIIIEAEKNEDLCTALRIKFFPTIIMYKNGEMKWRKSGNEVTNEEIKNNINSIIL